MRGKEDIHDYASSVKSAVEKIQKSAMRIEDKGQVLRFGDVLRSEGISLGRLAKYLNHMKILSYELSEQRSKGLVQAKAEDIEKLALWINESSYTPHTKRDYMIVLKRFYQWLRAPEEEYARWRRKHFYPTEVEDLSTALKLRDTRLPSDLLTEEDVRRLIAVSHHPMIRAYVAFSDEVGPRIGESLSMRVKDVLLDGTDLPCRLRGKAGERVVYLVKSVSMLTQ